jgi:hypothetical protein
MRDACRVRAVPLHQAGLARIIMTEGPALQLWWSTIISSLKLDERSSDDPCNACCRRVPSNAPGHCDALFFWSHSRRSASTTPATLRAPIRPFE